MLVGIIVPVYNVEQYLHDCIDSILNQTYKDFKLFLIDDGSKDNSGQICDKYKEKDNRITVFHQSNQGQSAARNVGINQAETDWILFVDSDDIIHPQMLEFLVQAVENSGASMSVCGRLEADSLPRDFYRKRQLQYDVFDVNEELLLNLFSSKDACLSTTYWLIYPKLVKKSVAMKHLFVEGRIFEDNEVSCKWLVESEKVAVLSECMYFYTTNPAGTMQSQLSLKKLDYLWALESKIQFYKELGYMKMVAIISKELLETAFYYHQLSLKESNKQVESAVKVKIKLIIKQYKKYLMIDKRIKDKLLKIYHPYLHKLMKRLHLR